MHRDEKILSSIDAKTLISLYEGKSKVIIKNTNEPIVTNYLSKIEKHSKYKFKNNSEYSYFEVQHKPKGHSLHFDTGSSNHMLWCGFSSSCLLTKPSSFTNGNVHFQNKDATKKITITPKEHYLTGISYRSRADEGKNAHFVDSHQGRRIVILMFLECEE